VSSIRGRPRRFYCRGAWGWRWLRHFRCRFYVNLVGRGRRRGNRFGASSRFDLLRSESYLFCTLRCQSLSLCLRGGETIAFGLFRGRCARSLEPLRVCVSSLILSASATRAFSASSAAFRAFACARPMIELLSADPKRRAAAPPERMASAMVESGVLTVPVPPQFRALAR